MFLNKQKFIIPTGEIPHNSGDPGLESCTLPKMSIVLFKNWGHWSVCARSVKDKETIFAAANAQFDNKPHWQHAQGQWHHSTFGPHFWRDGPRGTSLPFVKCTKSAT